MNMSLTGTPGLRILHLIASNFVGGPEQQILQHIREVAAPERKFWVGSFRDLPSRPDILKAAEDLGIPTLELSSCHFLPQTTLQLIRWLRRLDISLFCTHGYKPNVVGWLASRLAQVPQVCFARGWTAETWRIRQYERLDRLVLSRAPWVVTVSHALAKQLQQSRKGLEPPVVIPNAALFSQKGDAVSVDRQVVRRSLGLPADSFCVCAVGRLSAEKGQRYLLDALPSVLSANPNLCVIFLGEGRERKKLESRVGQLAVRGHVLFAGLQKQLYPWIQACDVLVDPSLSEGMPDVVLEAMALGTPVVATAVGGVAELIQNGECGLLVAPGSPAGISHALLSLWADPALSLRLARRAQARVREYSPEKQSRLLVDMYARASKLSQGQFRVPDIPVEPGSVADSRVHARIE